MHAGPLSYYKIVVGLLRVGGNSNVVDFRVELVILEAVGGEAQLEQIKVNGRFFDTLVKLSVISKITLNVTVLCYQTSELTVESHKMSLLNVL